MEIKNIIDIKQFNEWTILSLIFIIAGLIFWISWGITYGIWADIGVYSLTIVMVLSGLFGLILSLMPSKKE